MTTFGDELARALAVRGMSQRQLAKEIDMSQSYVAEWRSGRAQPNPDVVFEVEQILELPPGHLSWLLGYLPISVTKPSATSVEVAVTSDPLLEEKDKRALLAAYREMTAKPHRRK